MPNVAEPKIVIDKGKPSFVILDIADYEKLLEKAMENQDIKELGRLKKQRLYFRPFSEFLNEQNV